jgi:periplasmic copper chaperone A
MIRSLKVAAATVLFTVPVAANAHHDGEVSRLGDVVVSHAWTEETGAMAHGIDVFLTIDNQGDAAVRLVSVSTGFTAAGVFQEPMVGSDGALAIQEVAAIEVAPGQTVTFQPGGVHISLQNTQRALEGGEHFDMTLDFGEAGTVEVEVEIEHHDDEPGHEHEAPAS